EIPKENGSSIFVFTEHPDKPQDVPHVWDQAYEMGDSLIRAELEKDSAFKPESFSMYVERPERGADGEPRFAEYDAKTTKAENVSMVDNIYE
ncbi:hypothetical protein ACI4CV_27325, partial [Klebsiella pneumoniae]|uniref:hypothetical protein n=1 Tax=Klebsiella pneumoniae TaxID=573 RepID=UPI003852B793